MTSHAVWSLAAGTFVASLVEFVEALTIVLAMGLTRGWRSTLADAAAATAARSGLRFRADRGGTRRHGRKRRDPATAVRAGAAVHSANESGR